MNIKRMMIGKQLRGNEYSLERDETVLHLTYEIVKKRMSLSVAGLSGPRKRSWVKPYKLLSNCKLAHKPG